MTREPGVCLFSNCLGGAPSDQLVATHLKSIYKSLGIKQEYMSLVYM